MAKLPDKFSIAKPVVVDSVNGHPVRPVDVNGVALDDPTVQYSVAHPVIEVDATGTVLADSTRVFSMAKKVRISPTGTPIVITDPTGVTTGGTLTGGGVVSNISGTTYDTRIGSGVDANGFANLPLRAGAVRYYVGNGGSDVAAGTSHATRLATIETALGKVVQNNGDQICIAEGSTFATVFPYVNNKHGFSRLYPTVIQSYNTTFPTDETKMGRATGANRPSWTGSMAGGFLFMGSAANPMQNFAMRGIDINPGNTAGQNFIINGSAGLSPHGLLFENNLFRYTYFTLGGNAGKTGCNDIVIRGNSFFGSWSTGAMCQGAYISGVNNAVIEDNVFYHCGWKIGGTRDDSAASGGPTIFNHSLYFQDDASGIIRRNILIQGAATGLSARGNVDITGNVCIKNPVAIIGGLGTFYNLKQPYGVAAFEAYNAILESVDLSTAAPRSTAYKTGNGKLGSAVHHNLAAWGRPPAANSIGSGFQTDANYPISRYANYHDNLIYKWSASGSTIAYATTNPDGGNYTSYASSGATYNNNWWDDPASGTNLNWSSKTITTPYTAATLYTALGFADEATAFSTWYLNPDTKPAQTVRNALFTAYNLPTAGSLKDLLLAHDWFMVGTAKKALVMGVQDGSTLSVSGLPSSMTFDGPNRTLTYDGTGTPTTGSFTITETPVSGTAHNTTIPYQIVATKAAPVISSPTAVAAGSGSITIGVTTDTADGNIYWEVTTNATPSPEQGYVVDGIDANQAQMPSGQHGAIAVSSSGVKTVTVNGLTNGTTYYCYMTHVDSLYQTSSVASCPSVVPGVSNLLDSGTESELSLNGDSYNSGTHTVTAGQTNPATALGTWNGILVSGHTYNFSMTINNTQGPDVRINDGVSNVTSYFNQTGSTLPANGTDVVWSGTFVAGGTAFKLQASGGTFVGQIKNITVS